MVPRQSQAALTPGLPYWSLVTHMSRLTIPLIAALMLAPVALAQDQPEIDAIVASEAEPGEPQENVWDVTMADLERDHPAVARAVKQPNFIQEVSDEEEPSTQAFFEKMNTENRTAIRVAGELYTVGITLAQGNMPPAGDGDVDSDESSASSRGSPGLGLIGLLGALAAGAVALGRKA